MIVYAGAGINTRLTVQWNCDHVIALILTVGGQISFFCIRAQVMVRGKGEEPKEGNREWGGGWGGRGECDGNLGKGEVTRKRLYNRVRGEVKNLYRRAVKGRGGGEGLKRLHFRLWVKLGNNCVTLTPPPPLLYSYPFIFERAPYTLSFPVFFIIYFFIFLPSLIHSFHPSVHPHSFFAISSLSLRSSRCCPIFPHFPSFHLSLRPLIALLQGV